MKPVLFILSVLGCLTLSSIAQTNKPSEIHRIENGNIENIHCRIVRVFEKYIAVRVDDSTYHRKWSSTENDYVSEDGKILILENYDDINQAAEGQLINIKAQHAGTIRSSSDDDKVFELWNCDLREQEASDNKKFIELANKQEAELEKKRQIQEKRTQEANARAMTWLQSQATNGSVSAQCSLGLHYLNGQGCETNKALAIEWLQKAAVQGDSEASNKLAELK